MHITTRFKLSPIFGVTRGVQRLCRVTSWGRGIDDTGAFRSGYAIPAAYSNTGRSYAADAIERTVLIGKSATPISSLPGVEHLPFGTGRLGGEHAWTRALFGGFQFCEDRSDLLRFAAGYHGDLLSNQPRAGDVYAHAKPGVHRQRTYDQALERLSDQAAEVASAAAVQRSLLQGHSSHRLWRTRCHMPAYTFGNASRTAAYGLTGPGFFGMDISLRRSFPLHITESTKLQTWKVTCIT